MRARATYWMHLIGESFWFLPLIMTLAAVALSAGTLALDRNPPATLYRWLPWSEGLGSSNARLIMSTVSGSIITVASLVFSMTLVSLTLAARQLGPRLLSMFMRDRVTQVALGTFVATFVFALLVLASLGDPSDTILVPRASIFVALLLTLLSFGLLVAFIHHLARSLNADVVVARLAQDLRAQLTELLCADPQTTDAGDGSPPQWDKNEAIGSEAGGYIQTIDCKALVELACAHDTEIALQRRAGQFVHRGEPIALLRDDTGGSEEVARAVCGAIVFGSRRTDAEDPEFVIQAIVEIALRALSPGINDPYTARTCIDWLGEILAQVLAGHMPDHLYRDDGGRVRLHTVPHTSAGFFDAALNEIRQSAEGYVPVLIRMAETLERLATVARTSEQNYIVRHHAEMLDRSCERSIADAFDREDMRKRLRGIEAALKG